MKGRQIEQLHLSTFTRLFWHVESDAYAPRDIYLQVG